MNSHSSTAHRPDSIVEYRRYKWIVDVETTGCETHRELESWARHAQEYIDDHDLPIDVVTREELGCGSGLQLEPDHDRYDELTAATDRAFDRAWSQIDGGAQ